MWRARSFFSKEVTQMLLTLAHSKDFTGKLASWRPVESPKYAIMNMKKGRLDSVRQLRNF